MTDMSRLGMAFGQHVQQVTQELLLGSAPKSGSEMERRIREGLMRMGQFLLSSWLALQDETYPALTRPCRCGAEAHYVTKRAGVLWTLLGKINYRRAYYLCPHGHQGTYPLDEQLGLRPGEISAELESLLGMTGALMTFAKGSELFEQLTLVGVSPQTLDHATQEMGAERMAQEEEWLRASREGLAIARQERAPKAGRLYGALDATKVHTGEREGADDDGWRDLKVGVWFRTTAPPPSSPGSDWTMQAEAISYYCDIAEASKFGDLLWATGFQRQALQAQELIFLGDGADWIWNLVQEHYPEAVQIVDWFHAAERLAQVAHSAFPEEPEARRHWLERHREALWAGQVEAVVRACEALREQAGDEARKGAEYFRRHASRMRYATFRAQGYQIGSGTIESACKQLGIQRMKVPGATWTREGARRTAKARAALLSDQWDLLAKRREYLPRVA